MHITNHLEVLCFCKKYQQQMYSSIVESQYYPLNIETDLWAETKGGHHEEEQNSPQWSNGHLCKGFWVNDESEARTF